MVIRYAPIYPHDRLGFNKHRPGSRQMAAVSGSSFGVCVKQNPAADRWRRPLGAYPVSEDEFERKKWEAE